MYCQTSSKCQEARFLERTWKQFSRKSRSFTYYIKTCYTLRSCPRLSQNVMLAIYMHTRAERERYNADHAVLPSWEHTWQLHWQAFSELSRALCWYLCGRQSERGRGGGKQAAHCSELCGELGRLGRPQRRRPTTTTPCKQTPLELEWELDELRKWKHERDRNVTERRRWIC